MPIGIPDVQLQAYVPDSTTSSSWTAVGGASAHLCLQDASNPDEDFTYVKSNSNGQQVEVGFPAFIGDPGTDTGHTITVRVRKSGGSATGLLTLELRSSGTTVGTLTGLGLTTSYADYTWTLSAGEAAGITSYSALTVRMTSGNLSASEELRVTYVSLQFLTGIETRTTRATLRAANKEPSPFIRATRVGLRGMKAPQSVLARVTRTVIRALAPAIVEARTTKIASRAMKAPHFLDGRVTTAALRLAGPNIYGTQVIPGVLPSTLLTLMPANWAESIELRSSWNTDVFSARTLAEERRALIDRPYRTLSVTFTSMYLRETHDALMNMLRAGQQRQVFPLYCDASRVTATSSGTTINCDTTLRRIFIGCRVVIHSWTQTGRPLNPQYGIVRTFNTTSITLQTALTGSYEAGARVIPVMDVDLNLEQEASVITDQIAVTRFTVRELTGKSALASTSQSLPASIQLATDGVPIFNPRVEYSNGFQLRAVREADTQDQGRDVIVDPRGDRPLREYTSRFESRTRAEAWQVIQFFDYCRGRGRSFYLLSPETPFDVTGITSTSITVTSTSSAQNIRDFVKFVAIVKTDGTELVVPLGSVVDGGATFTISFTDIGSITLADAQRVTTAHLVRFKSDEMTESWETMARLVTDLEYIEVQREQSIVLAGLSDAGSPVISAPETIPNLTMMLESGTNVYKMVLDAQPTRLLGFALQHGDPVGYWEDVRAAVGSPSDPGGKPATSGTFNASTNISGVLAFYNDPQVNLGRPSVCMENSPTSGLGSALSLNSILNTGFFDPALGFTYVIHAQFPDAAEWNANYAFLFQTGVLQCEKGTLKPYTTLDTNNTANNITGLPNMNTRQAHTVVITWSPGAYLKFIYDGFQGGTGPVTVPASLPVNTSRSIDLFGAYSSTLGDPTRSVGLNFVALYKRALSNSELNSIGQYLTSRFGGTWSNL